MKPPTFHQFVEHHRLRVKLDECHDAIVRGKLGHLYEHDAGRFGIVLEAPADSARSDILLFDPADTNEARRAGSR